MNYTQKFILRMQLAAPTSATSRKRAGCITRSIFPMFTLALANDSFQMEMDVPTRAKAGGDKTAPVRLVTLYPPPKKENDDG
jgi:hypothetical protein